MKIRYHAALLLAASMTLSLFASAQTDTTETEDEDVVIENRIFKLKFYDKEMQLDSASRAELEQALKDAEISLEEAETELERIERRVEIRMDGLEDSIEKHIEREIVIRKQPSKPKLVETSSFVMDLGLNAFVNGNSVEMPEEYSGMNLDKIRSLNFHLGIVQQGLNLYKGKLRFVYGLGIEFNNFRFEEDIDLVKGSNPLAYTVNDEIEYRKNKLVSQYLTMPLMLNFKSNPRDEDESFKVAAGIQLGYLIGSHTKQKWGRGRDKEKRKTRGNYQFEDYRYGYVLQFGYGDVNIYGKYYPNSVFKKDRGPQVALASVGLVLTPF